MTVSLPNLDYVLAQLQAAGPAGYLSDGTGLLRQKQFRQACYQLRSKGYAIKRTHEDKYTCRYWLLSTESDEFIGPPKPGVRPRLLAWIRSNPGIERKDMTCIAPETTLRKQLSDLMADGSVVSCTKYRGGITALYFADEALRHEYMLTQPERPDPRHRRNARARKAYAAKAGAKYKPATKPAPKPAKRVTVRGQSISIPKATPKPAKPLAGPVDYSRAKVTQCPGFVPRDLTAGAVPYFSALAVGSYASSETHLSKVYA